VNDPNVDIVVVSVKTPEHYRLAKPALDAKKDVFVEWPLGANLKQAEELTALAKAQKVRHVIGLQGRQNSSVLKAKQMVAEGKLGDILGTTVSSVFRHRHASGLMVQNVSGAMFGATKVS
jgi:predicted dehydrogenase